MSDPIEISPEQRAVLEGLATGFSVKELAFKMGLTAKSVDSRKYRLMKRLGLRNRIELTRFAIEQGIVPVMALDEAPEPSQLTDRQREVVALTAAGLSVKEKAALLQISVRSADAHKHKAMHRLDIHDAVRLVHYCVRHHLTASSSTSDSAKSVHQDAPRDGGAIPEGPPDGLGTGRDGVREDHDAAREDSEPGH